MEPDPDPGVVNDPVEDLTARSLQSGGEAGESEQRVIERLADRIAVFGGSRTFILLFLSLLLAWIGLNTAILTRWGQCCQHTEHVPASSGDVRPC